MHCCPHPLKPEEKHQFAILPQFMFRNCALLLKCLKKMEPLIILE